MLCHYPTEGNGIGTEHQHASEHPRDRIHGHEMIETWMRRTVEENPAQPEHAGAEDGNQRRLQRMPQATQTRRRDLVARRDPLEDEHVGHSFTGKGGDLGIGSEQPKEEAAIAVEQQVAGQTEQRTAGHAQPEHALAAVDEPGTVVLSDKGDSCAREGTHQKIAVVLKVLFHRRSRYGCGTVAVDAGLNKHVAEREEHALHAGGDAYDEDAAQRLTVHMQSGDLQPERAALMAQHVYHAQGTEHVGQSRCGSHTRHAPL